jgi:hypothetical protein
MGVDPQTQALRPLRPFIRAENGQTETMLARMHKRLPTFADDPGGAGRELRRLRAAFPSLASEPKALFRRMPDQGA